MDEHRTWREENKEKLETLWELRKRKCGGLCAYCNNCGGSISFCACAKKYFMDTITPKEYENMIRNFN